MPSLPSPAWKRHDVPLRVARPPVFGQHASGDPGVPGGRDRASTGRAVGRDVPPAAAGTGGRMSDDRSRLGCALVTLGTLAVWVLIALAAWLIAVESPAQTVCCGPTGVLWTCTDPTCRGPLGLSCTPTGQVVPAGSCAAAPTPTPTSTPTPTAPPTPTATPTPTAPPMPAPTIATVTLGLPIPWTYTQGLSLYRGVLWGDAGNPTTGVNNGECIFSVDYTRTPPVFRVWACTGQTADSWESAYPKVDDDPANGAGTLIVAWIETHSVPPWGQTRGDVLRYGTITTLQARPVTGQAGALAVDDPAPFVRRDAIAEPQAWLWPLGWLHLGGQRQLYGAWVSSRWGEQPSRLVRWYWPLSGPPAADWQGLPPTRVPMASISDIAIDGDGSLIATETTGDNAGTMAVWRSRDEGRSWAVATTVQAAPGGSLFDCHFAHGAGGAAQTPWLLTCNSTPPSGSWANGGWQVVTVAWPGAVFPLYWGQHPAQPSALGMRALAAGVRLTTGAGPAPLSQLEVLRQLRNSPNGGGKDTMQAPPVASTATISGYCYTTTPRGKAGLGGVAISLSTVSARTCQSGFGGAYTTQAVPAGTYTVTPKLAGYVFTPPTAKVAVAGAPVTGVNFVAEKI